MRNVTCQLRNYPFTVASLDGSHSRSNVFRRNFNVGVRIIRKILSITKMNSPLCYYTILLILPNQTKCIVNINSILHLRKIKLKITESSHLLCFFFSSEVSARNSLKWKLPGSSILRLVYSDSQFKFFSAFFCSSSYVL